MFKLLRKAGMYVLTVLLSGVQLTANATTDPVITQPLFGSQGQFLVNAESYAKDLKYFSLSVANRSAILNNSILNMVGVGIEEQSNYFIRSNFSVTVTLQITTYNSSEASTGTFTKAFTVNYDTASGATYKALDYTTYTNAYALRAKIISIDSGTVNWPVSKVLKLENQLTATRDYPFNCNLSLDGLGLTLQSAYNELAASWTPPALDNNPGVTEYDLEWAWVDEGAVDRYKNGNDFVQDLIFTNNASRVTITGSSYNIPLLYDDTGRIFVRVRPVQVGTGGVRTEGKWSWILNDATQAATASTPVVYSYNGHEDKLNWQASTSFAEEGKRKSVVQYFDGSLRSRQTVTKDNTTNTTVVAESFYDYQGRAVIQVLPAPTLNTAIAYAKNFNQATGYNEYPKSVYDKLDVGASFCSNPAKAFNTDYGTANYYSAKNPLANAGANKYIPDATGSNPNEAYAFTETRLAADGRVQSQGGVGITHQIGSGHETKYYYEVPSQEELDALFGTDAGIASHYFKNIVQDANGQFSVSYVDMHNRTVATALAGEAPKNSDGTNMLDELDSKTQQQVTKQLLDRETNIVRGNTISSSKPIVVMKDNSTYAFDYSLNPQQLSLLSCTGTPICYDCLYQLKFTISSDCDQQLVYVDSVYNFTLGQYINSCNNGNANQGFIKHFEKVLNKGSYVITKTLTLSSEAQAAYKEVFIQNDTCRKLVDFYNQELQAQMAAANCTITCTSCKAALGGDLNGFIAKFASEMNVAVNSLDAATIAQLTASFNEAYANCQRICDNTDGLDIVRSTREMMLQDMTLPNGQYARVNEQTRNYNIFKANDPSNSSAGYGINNTQADYFQPRQFASNDQTLLSSNSFVDELGKTTTLSPGTTVSDFVNQFKPYWANQLLVHHPEFKKLQLSENQLKTSYQFEANLDKDTTWAQAASHNYITNLINQDPFFSGVGLEFKQWMLDGKWLNQNEPPAGADLNTIPVVHGMNKYVNIHTEAPCTITYTNVYPTMWQIALGTVFCRDKADGTACSIDYSNIATKAGCTMNTSYAQPQNGFSEGCASDRDWAWKIFKTLYMAERKKLVSAYLNKYAGSFIAPYDNNSTPPYQERFINHANPQAAFTNLNIADAGNIGDIINTAGNNLTQGNGQAQLLAQQMYDTVCRGYANTWIAQMRSCPQVAAFLDPSATNWVADSIWLVKRLVAVCKGGSDENHYLGSSSVKPGNVATVDGQNYYDFEKIVEDFLNNHGIAQPSAECYKWIINTPKPYDKQKPVANSYVLAKPSDCECQRISDLRLEWSNSGFVGTFSAWLQYKHGTYISNDQLDALTALCNGSYACKMLEKPITLPPALQCPSGTPAPKTCISCADYQAIKSDFYTSTTIAAPYITPQNQTEVNWNSSFAAYVNNKTGFSKTWQEYVAFQNTCSAANPVISCSSLDSTLNAFFVSPEYLANPIGLPCVQAFVNYFNNHYGVVYSYDQWMALFAQCGAVPNVCKPKITCSSLTALVNGFYDQNGVQVFKNSNCQNLFVSYVNTQLGSNYTFAQLESIHSYVCQNSCGLNVCGFPNQFLLNRMVAAFRAAYPQPWNLADCRGTFATFFNNYFGLPISPSLPVYDFDGINNNYFGPFVRQGCAEDITNICTPPYSCTQLQTLVTNFLAQYTGPAGTACQSAFTTYFNNAMGTSYTYLQIANIYKGVCGGNLNVCNVTTDCASIITFANSVVIDPTISVSTCQQQFMQQFNTNFGTSYTNWTDLYNLYQACGYDLGNICKARTPLALTCKQLTQFVQAFTTSYPDPATQLGGQCQDYFTAQFNQNFSCQYTYAEIAAYYQQQCGTTLNVCSSPCIDVKNFILDFNARYSTLKLPQAAKEDLFTWAYNARFVASGSGQAGTTLTNDGGGKFSGGGTTTTDPKVFNPVVSYTSIQQFISTCPNTSFSAVPSVSISETDVQVLLSLKQVYYTIHPNGLPDACQSDFAGWYNRVMQKQYTYQQVQALYNSVCGNNAGYICEPPPSSLQTPSIYVDFMPVVGPGALNLPPMLCGLNEPGGGPAGGDDNPCKDIPKIAWHFALDKYELYVDSLRNVFDTAYHNKCMAVKELESFTVTYQQSEYHYTLYYYDQAGNLVRTVPPAGVVKLNATEIADAQQKRKNVLNGQPENTNKRQPLHTLATDYRYNTLNQLIMQNTPDAGISRFWYDRLGRLVVSQNAKQAAEGKYSYTLYDDLGRITEVGQKPQSTAMTQTISRNAGAVATVGTLANWLTGGGVKEQITCTVYDFSYAPLETNTAANGGFYAKNLRNRVSYTYYKNQDSNDPNYNWNAATLYSYDIHGNVDILLQDYGSSQSSYSANIMNSVGGVASGHRWKRFIYNYDLISGKVNMVSYQPGQVDQFYHRYSYDAENRITLVETSADKVVWEKDARYSYYKHGPLARTVLGELQVQGIDYAYTIQGWLKGVNGTAVSDGTYDIGQDGKTGSANNPVTRDVYGFSLNYFSGDYKQISTAIGSFINNTFSLTNGDGQKIANPLYNGNIASMLVNIPKIGTANLYGYKYDQLNRIKSMDAFTGLNSTTNAFTATITQAYKERVAYDANGNIKTYLRNGDGARLSMDDMVYTYKTNTNQLDKVVDNAFDAAAGQYDNYKDIKRIQPNGATGQQSGNYQYDAIGNLTADASEGITSINWNVYGKIQTVTKNGNTIAYTYDAAGNRISKTMNGKTTWYVRDAAGIIVSVYTVDLVVNSGHLTQHEVYLLGNTRLGIWNADRDVTLPSIANYQRGNKAFELSNHLQNVLVTVSDKKIGVPDPNNSSQIQYYTADIATVNDYYPGGMMMPGRKYQAGSGPYRFGFNGKESDNDINGEGNAYDYGDRIFNPRVVSWLSIDKLQAKHPGESPYLFVGGSPIVFIDPDGRDRIVTHIYKDKAGNIIDKIVVTKRDKSEIMSIRHESTSSIMGGGSSLVYTYDWYNIGQNITHIIGDDGKEISSTIGNEYATGEVRTNTNEDWKWWASLKLDGKEDGYGGIAFFGKDGQGEETKIGSFDDLKMENIDALMAAFSALKTTLGAKPFATMIREIDKAKTLDEKIDAFTKAVKTALSYAKVAVKTTHDIIENNKEKSEKSKAKKGYYCTDCGRTFFPQSNGDTLYFEPGKKKKSEIDTINVSSPEHPKTPKKSSK